MDICYTCGLKLEGENSPVFCCITPNSEVSYEERIVDLMGDDYAVIVTPNDQLCKRCASHLTHIDNLENELKLVRTTLLSYIQKKYGMLPPDHAVENVEIVNGQLKLEKQLERGQHTVSSGLAVGVSPTATTVGVVSTVQTPLHLFKTQHQQQQQQQQHQPQQQHHQRQKRDNLMKISKCGICTYQSKELGHVKYHMLTRTNKKEQKTPILNQAAAKALIPNDDKSTVDMDMIMINPTDFYVNVKLEKEMENALEGDETENSQKYTTAKETKLKIKTEPAQEEDDEVNDHLDERRYSRV